MSRAGSTHFARSDSIASAPETGAWRTISPGRGTRTTAGSRSTSRARGGSSAHGEPRDEEAGGRVDVRKGLEKLGTVRVTERRPVGSECRVEHEGGRNEARLRL